MTLFFKVINGSNNGSFTFYRHCIVRIVNAIKKSKGKITLKIFVSKFVLEANENIPMKTDLENMDICYGDDCIERMQIKNDGLAEKIELIPGIYADGASNGVMKRTAFEYIEEKLLSTMKENLKEIDGIYLHLHGASKVEEIGSGDHHILREIRKIVGPYLPIAITCDPHGNLNKDYVENATIIRSYRESPHTDINQTIEFVFQNLISILKCQKTVTPIYRKLPLILGGEQSVSSDEPVVSINKYLAEIEMDSRIMSASWHVGYIRHDTPDAGCGIVVIPNDNEHYDYAETVADNLENYIWERRHTFHYTGLTKSPEEALKMAIEYNDKPVFITDSGDNVTSGAMGANTFLLNQILELSEAKGKKFLFAAIHDKKTYSKLDKLKVDDETDILLGMKLDELSSEVELRVKVKAKGRQRETKIFGEDGDFGGVITVSVVDRAIDILITDTNHPFVEHPQFQAASVDWNSYDIVVVKIGYAFPELKEHGKLCVMSLTKGATLQDTASLPFKLIMRPMFPIDDI